MTSKKQEDTPQAGQDQVVDRLYDVAINPIHYEDLIDAWSNAFSLDGSDGGMPPDDNDEVFRAHARRASDLLDRHQIVHPYLSWEARLHDVKTRAAFMMDGLDNLLAVNGIAQKTLGLAKGSPTSSLPFRDADLESLKQIALNSGKQKKPVSVVMRIRRTDNNRPVILRITPVESDRPSPVILVVLAEIVWLESFSDHLCQTFKLTPAEADIVRHIVSGLPANDIALARSTSIGTVRTQIKSILDKTDTHSQTELVRTIIGLLDVLPLASEDKNDAGRPVKVGQIEFQSIMLSDGRRYDYRVFGDPDGIDCLYMHMDFGLVLWPEDAERAALEEGLRVIVPVRAGYGNSDPAEVEADFRDGAVNDMLELLAHLNVDKFVVLTQASDLRFAVAMAPLTPERLQGIIGCAAQLPLQNAIQYQRMDKWHRYFSWNARYSPQTLPFLVKAGFALAQLVGKERLLLMVNGGSPADIQTFSRPDVREAILKGSDVVLSKDYSADMTFCRELIDHENDWTESLRDCPVSIELFQGDQDPQSPLETVNEILEDMEHVRVNVLKNAGQLLFFAAWPQILPRVKILHDY